MSLWWAGSLALHAALGVWFLRPPDRLAPPQEPQAIELEIYQPAQASRPLQPREPEPARVRVDSRSSPSPGVIPHALASSNAGGEPDAAVAPASPGAGARTEAGGAIEERWRLPERLKNYEIVRAALRKAQPSRLCNGALDGVLSTDEKTFCYEVYWGRGAARAGGQKRLADRP